MKTPHAGETSCHRREDQICHTGAKTKTRNGNSKIKQIKQRPENQGRHTDATKLNYNKDAIKRLKFVAETRKTSVPRRS